jgi:hypothetical protein
MAIKKLFTLLLIGALATSCNKNNEPATGTGDAIIVIKKSGDNTVYGISLYAYTFGAFKKVTAVSSANPSKTYTLGANQGYKSNFYYLSPDAEFSTTLPVAATIDFSAVFENGETNSFQDELSNKVLTVPVIDKLEFDSSKTSMTVSWTSVPNADSYAINVLDGETVVYVSPELAKTVKTFPVTTTGAWSANNPPVNGKLYTVKVYAFLYENGINAYNVQAAAVGVKTVNWGTTVTN